MIFSKLSVVHPDSKIGINVRIYDFVNIYGPVEIGDDCVIGAFVEIQPGVKIGKNVKISSHTFICTGVTIEDNVFIGHGVMFINDKNPRSVDDFGKSINANDTNIIPTIVKRNASIGTSAVIMCGLIIGENSMVGAGSVLLYNTNKNSIVVGNPAREISKSRGNSSD